MVCQALAANKRLGDRSFLKIFPYAPSKTFINHGQISEDASVLAASEDAETAKKLKAYKNYGESHANRSSQNSLKMDDEY
ncbi:hypothetical protein DPMN_015487 [Dreissena polymorpha]|uniref:Uncharacterized protein n=1 Tax=Dreissena polymorpha TaxID=45954 RepID=A0A9D4S5L4_DREPO|nr:hypothetical protein DPMN_015487 [Dreissena polymorpha]